MDEGMNGWGNRVSTVRPALGESERKAGSDSTVIFKLVKLVKKCSFFFEIKILKQWLFNI